jgi:hypothetical protein
MIVHNLKAFARFWYDFIVGDDWVVAAGVVVLLVVSGVLARANMHTSAWVLMPVGVVVVLAISLRRAALGERSLRGNECLRREGPR